MRLSPKELSLLQKTFLLQDCSTAEIENLFLSADTGCQLRTFRKNEILFSPEHFRRELGILLTGSVLVTKPGGLVVSELHAGDLFGAGALFNQETDYVSTLTARSSCRVLFVTEDALQAMIDCSHHVRWNYIRYLSGRIRFLSSRVDALAENTGERRLASWLLAQMDADNNVLIPCSMTELARRLNVGRTSLYRELGLLQDSGIVLRAGRTLHVEKPELLTQ